MVFSRLFITILHSSFSTLFSTVFSHTEANSTRLLTHTHTHTQIRTGFRYSNNSFCAGEEFCSLCIQEVHQWPQHVIGVGLHLVTGVGVYGTLDLVQQTGHLTHAVINAALETTEEDQSSAMRRNMRD